LYHKTNVLANCYNKIMLSVGIDEVGRGCWAGPVVAGAVILQRSIAGLKDSKKLSRLQREKLAEIIHTQARAVGIGWVSARELDDIGLTVAVRLAMQRALAHITASYDEIIIDGNYNFLADLTTARTVIKADDSIACVSAASIVAKVARDNYMREQALLYPEYGFDTHVGYGSARHLAMLQKSGICSLHRLSFKPIQTLLGASGKELLNAS
jgi:ribonuclease HII